MNIKKLLTVILTGILLLGAMSFVASAASASVRLAGPEGTIRAGDTIKITVSVSGSDIYGVSGNVTYDSSKLTFNGATSLGWNADYNGGSFTAYSSSPLNGSQSLLQLTFTVKASAGDTISVTVSGVKASGGGDAPFNGNGSTYSKTITAPLSTENSLSSLTISNATLSPSFNENVTSYSAGTVPFSISRLDVKATAKDSAAKVSVSGDSLSVGSNTVKITVTAESGATKIYTITVTREQDPNYVKESNNAVSSITIDNFLISPPFDANIKSYIVWLPYETTSITIKAQPASSKASVVVEGGSDLKEGNNEIKIICTAEDGTVQVYLVVAKRATQDSSVIAPYEPPTDPDPTTNTDDGFKNLMVYALMPVLLVGGFGSGYAVNGAKKKSIRAKRRASTEKNVTNAINTDQPDEYLDSESSTENNTLDFADFNFDQRFDDPPEPDGGGFLLAELSIIEDIESVTPILSNMDPYSAAENTTAQNQPEPDGMIETDAAAKKEYSYGAFSATNTDTNVTFSQDLASQLSEILSNRSNNSPHHALDAPGNAAGLQDDHNEFLGYPKPNQAAASAEHAPLYPYNAPGQTAAANSTENSATAGLNKGYAVAAAGSATAEVKTEPAATAENYCYDAFS